MPIHMQTGDWNTSYLRQTLCLAVHVAWCWCHCKFELISLCTNKSTQTQNLFVEQFF